MRRLGTAAAITHKPPNPKNHATYPLHHKPEVIKTARWQTLLEELEMTAIAAETFKEEVLIWAPGSLLYGDIRRTLTHPIDGKPLRQVVGKLKHADATLLCKPNANNRAKLRPRAPNETILAWCNAFERVEMKVPPRRRALFEPIINDIIKTHRMPITVQYATKKYTREGVLNTSHGYRADMAAWFDELDIEEDLFGVIDDEGCEYTLGTTPMGFMPSCRIAHGTLKAIAPSAQRPTPLGQYECLFVDNVNHMGTAQQAQDAMDINLERAAACGARLNLEAPAPQQQYEFLGEAYDHVNKTRALTTKFLDKITQVKTLIKKPIITARQCFGIVGTICYAAEVLDMDLTDSTRLLKEHAEIARDASLRSTWHHKVALSKTAIQEAQSLINIAADNQPVHVTNGHKTINDLNQSSSEQIIAYVDASRWGWGAIVIQSGQPIRYISQAWTAQDHEQHLLSSSVTAEPLAIRRLLCTISPTANIIIYTDHQPLCCIVDDRWSATPSYNAMLALIRDLSRNAITVTLRFIPGENNPADPLSRGLAPILPVTHIAGKRVDSMKTKG